MFEYLNHLHFGKVDHKDLSWEEHSLRPASSWVFPEMLETYFKNVFVDNKDIINNKKVLDIGCGNGYHLFCMLASGAKLALGIDPTLLFFYQFQLINRFLPDLPIHLLPLRGEHLPAFGSFDTVFSLGVLYHRRNPIDHLTELLGFLNSGGEVVLETLVVDGDANTVLVPEDRYAKMSNVWFLPSPDALEIWMSRAGFKHVRVVDINQTSIEEQRATEWMTFHSLADFLDPLDSNQTFEGYPAPKRALVIAQKP